MCCFSLQQAVYLMVSICCYTVCMTSCPYTIFTSQTCERNKMFAREQIMKNFVKIQNRMKCKSNHQHSPSWLAMVDTITLGHFLALPGQPCWWIQPFRIFLTVAKPHRKTAQFIKFLHLLTMEVSCIDKTEGVPCGAHLVKCYWM